MTDDRSLDRAARSFIEPGPTRAPEAAVDAALRTIQTTPQERDLRIPWRVPRMIIPARLGSAAAIAVLAIGVAAFVIRRTGQPGIGGLAPSASPPASVSAPTSAPTSTPTPAMAGPLEIGTYVGPTLQVTDIIAMANVDRTLSAADRTQIVDELLAIRGKSTWSASIELRAGQLTERQTVDGKTETGSFGGYSFPDERTLVYTEAINGTSVVTRFELTVDGDSFTLHRVTPAHGAADEFVTKIIFESGPFVLRR